MNFTFITGIIERIKTAEGVFDMSNTNIFPTLNSQQKWKFSRVGNQFRLSDGTNVYTFQLPFSGDLPMENFSLKRIKDPPLTDFDRNASVKGMAQVHRATPGSIYFTLQGYKNNPTFLFKHVNENEWLAIPKKSKSLAKQASVLGTIGNTISAIPDFIKNIFMVPGYNPPLFGLGAAGLGMLYHIGRRQFYNTPEENAQEGLKTILKRVLLPGLLVTGSGYLTRGIWGGQNVDNWWRYGTGIPNLVER